VLYVLGATDQTYGYASQYYTWLVLGSTFVIFSLGPSNLLRTEGAAIASMIGSIIGTVINIILDPVFIFKLGYGAAGAAMATVIGQISTCLFFVLYISKKSKVLTLSPSHFKTDFVALWGILVIGLPSSITNLMQTIGIALTNRFLLPYGDENIAVMGIVLKIVNIAVLVIVGLSFGGQPLIGYNYGARNMKRVRDIMKFGIRVTAGTATFILLVISLFADLIVSGFLRDERLIALGVHMLRIQLLGMPFMAICLIFICAFQSTGKALSALTLSACRQGLVYLPVIVICSAFMNLEGVIISQAISDVVTTAVAVLIFRIGLYKNINASEGYSSQARDL
jgi:putative MATE family efflux protein